MSSKIYRVLKRSIKSLKATEYSKRTGKRDWTYVRYELWCAFLDTFIYSWYTPVVVFFESCHRTIKWFPIIWKSRDWDHSYLFEVMQAKLRFMREHLTKYGHEVWKSRQRKIKQLRICEILLDRMMQDDYCREEHNELANKWGSLHIGKKGIYRSKTFTEQDKEQEFKEFRKFYEKQKDMYQQDLELFCEIFKKYHKGWWD